MVITGDTNKIVLQPNEQPNQYQLVDFVVAMPSEKPDLVASTSGRPFEFALDLPSKFIAMCPFCCAGFYIEACNITEKYGYKFVICPECGAGKPKSPAILPVFVDPFINPFSSKQLARCELDETVTPISSLPSNDSLTVAQKMSRSI
jgi:hypothetical protein